MFRTLEKSQLTPCVQSAVRTHAVRAGAPTLEGGKEGKKELCRAVALCTRRLRGPCSSCLVKCRVTFSCVRRTAVRHTLVAIGIAPAKPEECLFAVTSLANLSQTLHKWSPGTTLPLSLVVVFARTANVVSVTGVPVLAPVRDCVETLATSRANKSALPFQCASHLAAAPSGASPSGYLLRKQWKHRPMSLLASRIEEPSGLPILSLLRCSSETCKNTARAGKD